MPTWWCAFCAPRADHGCGLPGPYPDRPVKIIVPFAAASRPTWWPGSSRRSCRKSKPGVREHGAGGNLRMAAIADRRRWLPFCFVLELHRQRASTRYYIRTGTSRVTGPPARPTGCSSSIPQNREGLVDLSSQSESTLLRRHRHDTHLSTSCSSYLWARFRAKRDSWRQALIQSVVGGTRRCWAIPPHRW